MSLHIPDQLRHVINALFVNTTNQKNINKDIHSTVVRKASEFDGNR